MQILFGPQNLSLQRVPNATYFLGNVTITSLNIAEIVVGWAAIALLLVFLRKTQYGRAINAVRTNSQVAMAVGISVDRIYLLVMMIGSLLVGMASLLFLMGNVAFPTMGLTPILIGFIAVFLGRDRQCPRRGAGRPGAGPGDLAQRHLAGGRFRRGGGLRYPLHRARLPSTRPAGQGGGLGRATPC